MRTLGRRGAAMAALAMLLGLVAGGCSKSGTGFDLTGLFRPPPNPGPSPGSPADALRLFEWSYNNKAIAEYREIFADDYRFFFSPLDSAGAFYRTTPWIREDELISTTHLFAGGGADQPPASSIRLTLDKTFLVAPDPNCTPWDPAGRWHKNIRTQVVLSIQTSDGNGIDISGAANFYLVRGDRRPSLRS